MRRRTFIAAAPGIEPVLASSWRSISVNYWEEIMQFSSKLVATFLSLGITFCATAAVAQISKDQVIGTWTLTAVKNILTDGTSTDSFGPSPRGTATFDGKGRFSIIIMRSDHPKFASNNRATGSADENKAVVQGSIAYFGTYSVVDKVIIEKVEGGTWPNWVGTEQKRPIISLTGDETKLSTPAASIGGTAENTYKRIK